MKLIGKNNKKLQTRCKYTNLKRSVLTGNKLMKFAISNKCLGVSANQFGILERVCIAKVNGKFEIFIDPKIIKSNGKQISKDEGCLSFPGIRRDIERSKEITVSWITVNNWIPKEHEKVFKDFDAIVLEHEIDHLNGIRLIDK